MIAYTRDQVYKATLEYFGQDQLATETWINKYCLKDSYNNYYELTPRDMHRRLAKEFARIESKYPNPMSEDEIFSYFDYFKYIVPQGSPMAGIGNPFQLISLSNCFVIGNKADSYGGILLIDQEMVQLQKRRAGVGTDLSHLRPGGAAVNNAALTSTGLASFMHRFSNSTNEVAQDGRRGALMLTCSIEHPESPAFIDSKIDRTKITGANISSKFTDEFLKAVENNENFIHRFPIGPINEKTKVTKELNARNTFKKFVHNAWESAEPGALYWDTILRESVPDCYADLGFETISTNPCGEITLCYDDSCRLLVLNLFSFVINPFTKDAYFDFNSFSSIAKKAQRLMDDLIDLELEAIDKIIQKIKEDPEAENIKKIEIDLWERIKDKCIKGRRTGTGVTGEGDMLAALSYTYGTKEATEFSGMVHRLAKKAVYTSSVELAKERGAFPIYDSNRELKSEFIKRLASESPELYLDMCKYGRRNIALMTIAPTGTVSIMTQTTSGIEPVFKIYYKRRRKINPNDKSVRIDFVDANGVKWQEYFVFHHGFEKWLQINGYDVDYVKSLTSEQLDEIVAQSPYYKATAEDTDWLEKIKMQGLIQKEIDHSISVTVNLPKHVTEELVFDIYMTAWKYGCKGCTIYREGSRDGVLIDAKETSKKNIDQIFADNHAPKRPKELQAEVLRFVNYGQKWIAFIGILHDRPYEIFTGKEDAFNIPKNIDKGIIKKIKIDGQNRYDFICEDGTTIEGLSAAFDIIYHNYSKMLSGVLRHGMPIPYVISLVEGLHLEQERLDTWKTGVVRALKKYIKDGTKVKGKKCLECNSDELQYAEGCLTCRNCGNSKCG